MKTANTQTSPNRWLVVAAALVAFGNLSGARIHSQGIEFGLRSLASTSKSACEPSLQEQLKYSDIASCKHVKEVKGIRIETEVKVDKAKRDIIDRSGAEDVRRTESGFLISAKTNCQNCEGRDLDIDEEVAEQFIPRSSTSIDSIAESLIKQNNRKFDTVVTKQLEYESDRKNCRIDDDGEKITNSNDVFSCRMEQLAIMDDKEGADYFKANIQGEIQALLESGNSAEVAKGMALARQLQFQSRNPYVKEAAADLGKYGEYTTGLGQLQTQLDSIKGNSSQEQAMRQQIQARMQTMQGTWQSYFQARGILANNMIASGNDPNSFFADLATSANSLQNSLDLRFQQIVSAHSNYLNSQTGVNANNQLPPGVQQPSNSMRVTNGNYTSCVTQGIPQLNTPVNRNCGSNLGQLPMMGGQQRMMPGQMQVPMQQFRQPVMGRNPGIPQVTTR